METELIRPSEKELLEVKKVDDLLSKSIKGRKIACLIGPSGEKLELPDPVYQTLRKAVHLLASGNAISIVPEALELSTQEAANILNVSRPFLVKLIERGEIPYHPVGTHRRISFSDLMTYKNIRDRKRKSALQKLTELTEEYGLYDEEFKKD